MDVKGLHVLYEANGSVERERNDRQSDATLTGHLT